MTTTARSAAAPATLQLGNANDFLDRVISKLDALDNTQKLPLMSVLRYLSDYIHATRRELRALRCEADGGKLLTSSASELEEVVSETENATGNIMSAAETIEVIATRLDKQTAEELTAAVTRIYEASAFQDITGQRITKVMGAIDQVENRIDTLLRFCNTEAEATPKPKKTTPLVNGPQLQKMANTQDDIDRLFASINGPP